MGAQRPRARSPRSRSDATDVAGELRRRTLDLVHRSGPAEYFSALDGRGFGAHDFSWTAALTVDLFEGSAR